MKVKYNLNAVLFSVYKGEFMYINEIDVENLGPIEKANIKFNFNGDESPKPLILVGKNGSGKSTLISNIVDSFYEFAAKAYSNILINDKNNSSYTCYYKILSPIEINFGKSFLYSHIIFQDNICQDNIDYLFVHGNGIPEETLSRIGCPPSYKDSKNVNISFKEIISKQSGTISNLSPDRFRNILSSQVLAYFPPDRYERPNWLHKSYYERISDNFISDGIHLNINEEFIDDYKNPITVNCGESDLLHWLLDIIADSRIDADLQSICENNDDMKKRLEDIKLFSVARHNVQKILTAILGEAVKFELKSRSYGDTRFVIVRKKDKKIIAPSLNSLSSGQIALFKMFATLVKYADSYDVQRSCDLSNIEGIVVIDEIELHLHPSMQADVLPKLIKLFPKVQFIITTHSPLFLLGMDKVLGNDSYDLVDLPSASKISTEAFSEFISAFKYYEYTSYFEKERQSVLSTLTSNSNSNSPLIITEGQTDWVHLEAAYRALSQDSKNNALFSKLGLIKFFEYEATEQSHIISELGLGIKEGPLYKAEMGDKALLHLCESFSKLPINNLVICIFDRDVNDTFKKATNNGSYRDWGNKVFSFAIPIPNEDREKTPLISIEHYYSDNEIKTTQLKGDVECRLYMGCEFDAQGRMINGDKLCNSLNKCGEGKINILSRGVDKIISKDSSDQNDYSLSKADFAWNIYNKEAGFNNFDFSNFIKIFEMIRDIIEHYNSQKQKESSVNIINDGQNVNIDQ